MEISDFITKETVIALPMSIFLLILMFIEFPGIPILNQFIYSAAIAVFSFLLSITIVKLISPRKRN